jgi:hypothetical protein
MRARLSLIALLSLTACGEVSDWEASGPPAKRVALPRWTGR